MTLGPGYFTERVILIYIVKFGEPVAL
jgi:hypothetical protein